MAKKKSYLTTEEFMRAWKRAENFNDFEIFAASIRKAHKDEGKDEPSNQQINMRCFRINAQIKNAGYKWRYKKPTLVRRENMTIKQILERCEDLHGNYIPPKEDEEHDPIKPVRPREGFAYDETFIDSQVLALPTGQEKLRQ